MHVDLLFIIKILVTLFVIILIPNYWKNNGPGNFLWLSDVGLFMTVLALWFHSSLLISMASVGILLPEIAWNIDFFLQLFTGRNFLGIADYMFDPKELLSSRRLSLFHIGMPIIWIICLIEWRYDSRAFFLQIILTWIVFILTFFLTIPEKNINWVFMPKEKHWKKVRPIAWLIFLLVAYPLVIIVPSHLLLKKFVG